MKNSTISSTSELLPKLLTLVYDTIRVASRPALPPQVEPDGAGLRGPDSP
jgi:hypothetical protein